MREQQKMNVVSSNANIMLVENMEVSMKSFEMLKY